MRDHLELPRPLRLLATIAWSLIEAAGLPVGALVVVAWLSGRDAGLLAGLGATWLTVLIRKAAGGRVPALLTISALVLTAQTAMVLVTGELWLYLLQFPAAQVIMAVLFARTARSSVPLVGRLAEEMFSLRPPGHHPALHRFFQGATWLWAALFLLIAVVMGALLATEPPAAFMMASAAVTAGLIAAGIGGSALWFRAALRRAGLRLRFASSSAA
jgi:hypothetical protein